MVQVREWWTFRVRAFLLCVCLCVSFLTTSLLFCSQWFVHSSFKGTLESFGGKLANSTLLIFDRKFCCRSLNFFIMWGCEIVKALAAWILGCRFDADRDRWWLCLVVVCFSARVEYRIFSKYDFRLERKSSRFEWLFFPPSLLFSARFLHTSMLLKWIGSECKVSEIFRRVDSLWLLRRKPMFDTQVRKWYDGQFSYLFTDFPRTC